MPCRHTTPTVMCLSSGRGGGEEKVGGGGWLHVVQHLQLPVFFLSALHAKYTYSHFCHGKEMVEPVWIAILCLTFTLLTLLFVIQSKMMCHYSNAAINTDIKTTISDPVNAGGGPYFGLKKKKKKAAEQTGSQ